MREPHPLTDKSDYGCTIIATDDNAVGSSSGRLALAAATIGRKAAK